MTEEEGHKLPERSEFLCPPKATAERGEPRAKFSKLEIISAFFAENYFVKALIRFIRAWAAFLLHTYSLAVKEKYDVSIIFIEVKLLAAAHGHRMGISKIN